MAGRFVEGAFFAVDAFLPAAAVFGFAARLALLLAEGLLLVRRVFGGDFFAGAMHSMDAAVSRGDGFGFLHVVCTQKGRWALGEAKSICCRANTKAAPKKQKLPFHR